ncbi:hypothetical protein FA13DRAFT_1714383 [Coprinellus micaceus]|uniref:F-box domain-containing protein n=1 Tax=Coprinellus micaceus TaxID=71717 RepID=A0A4Y7SS90_COPMI|nr:hypothetical protein FA13DRAFT_1714383 [Coprinellus micaceus]
MQGLRREFSHSECGDNPLSRRISTASAMSTCTLGEGGERQDTFHLSPPPINRSRTYHLAPNWLYRPTSVYPVSCILYPTLTPTNVCQVPFILEAGTYRFSRASSLYEDIARIITRLVYENSLPQDAIDGATVPIVTAPIRTLVRLSHINTSWRAIVLSEPRLWAHHISIHPRTPFSWLREISRRAQLLPVRLHVLDANEPRFVDSFPLWFEVKLLFERCTYLRLAKESPSLDVNLGMLGTAAPILQECDIFCDTPRQALTLWRPIFDRRAPNLRRMRILKWGDGLVGDVNTLPDITLSGLLSLGGMTQLQALELSLPGPTAWTERQELTSQFAALHSPVALPCLRSFTVAGDPNGVSHLLNALRLPKLHHLSVVYNFTQTVYPFTTTDLLWSSLFRTFPSIDYPSLEIHDCDGHIRFCFAHTKGQVMELLFNADRVDVDSILGATCIPQLVLPSSQVADPTQVLHSIIWTSLILVDGFSQSVKVVTIDFDRPGSPFPHHLHLLLCFLVEVKVLQFIESGSAQQREWFDFLVTKSVFSDLPALPFLDHICMPVSATNLSHSGLREYLEFRHDIGCQPPKLYFSPDIQHDVSHH